MEHINFLRQASLADKMGNYKLADNLFLRALRLAGGAVNIFEAEIMKLLERLALTAEEKEALKLGEKSLVKTWEKGGSATLADILEKRGIAALSDEAATKEFLRSVGITEEEALTKAITELKGKTPADQKDYILGRIGAEIARIESTMAAKTIVQRAFNKETVIKALKGLGTVAEFLYKNPNNAIKGLAYLSSVGVVYDITTTGIEFFSKLTGKKLEIPQVLEMLKAAPGLFSSGGPESTPPGSTPPESAGSGSGAAGEGGAAGIPDPTTAPGFQYKTKEDMYERRMKAKLPDGKFQQTSQGDKAQKFVEDNKTKYKTQREFYNAALAAGDKNFANSVIALVKKDLDLNVDTNDPRKF
jgi:hypothetical protein